MERYQVEKILMNGTTGEVLLVTDMDSSRHEKLVSVLLFPCVERHGDEFLIFTHNQVIKRIEMEHMSEEDRANAMQEVYATPNCSNITTDSRCGQVAVLRALPSHPNIVGYHNSFVEAPPHTDRNSTFEEYSGVGRMKSSSHWSRC